jgi:hypothetical protein
VRVQLCVCSLLQGGVGIVGWTEGGSRYLHGCESRYTRKVGFCLPSLFAAYQWRRATHSLPSASTATPLRSLNPHPSVLILTLLFAGNLCPTPPKPCRDAGEQDLVGLVVGLARLGYTPPRRWVAVYLRVVGAKAPLVSPRGRATITAALADLGWAPAEQQRIMVSML